MSSQQAWVNGVPFHTVILVDPTTGETYAASGGGGSQGLTDAQLRAAAVVVSASARSCVGRQTLSVTTGTVATLTVPVGAVAATIQADGSAVSVTLDGTTPTATVGSRIDDGVFYYVDTPLTSVKLIARSSTTNVQVAYFDKA